MAKKEYSGVVLHFKFAPAVKRLNLEEKGKLLDAVLDFGINENVPEFDGMLGMLWDLMMPDLIYDRERWYARCEQNASNVNKRWHPNDSSVYNGMQSNTKDTNTITSTSSISSTNSSQSINIGTKAYPSSETEVAARKRTRRGAGEEGENPDTLYAEYCAALDDDDLTTAGGIANQLYRLGYDVNKDTRQMKRR